MKQQTILTLYIRAGKAQNGPPLGTILGNIGVATIKFVKEFNEFTNTLPDYFLLSVRIVVQENKSFTFFIRMPSVGFILSLLKKEEITKDLHGISTTTHYVLLEDFIQLCKFKFPNNDLNKSAKTLQGTLLSSRIIIK
jgi:ribosomal protein L11